MDPNPYAPPDAQPANSQMICHSCGIMAPPGSQVCSGCGAAIGAQNVAGVIRENHELRAAARAQLSGKWLAAAALLFVYYVLSMGLHVIDAFMGWTIPGYIVQYIVGGPLTLGMMAYFLANARGTQVRFGNLFDGFQQFGKSAILYFLFSLFVMLWSLLLIVPGIIKSFSYSMSYFILRDNPEIGAMEALSRSKKMMNGYKWKLFCLYLSFTGWFLLSALTLGIGSLWVGAYAMQSMANFYEDIKYNNA